MKDAKDFLASLNLLWPSGQYNPHMLTYHQHTASLQLQFNQTPSEKVRQHLPCIISRPLYVIFAHDVLGLSVSDLVARVGELVLATAKQWDKDPTDKHRQPSCWVIDAKRYYPYEGKL